MVFYIGQTFYNSYPPEVAVWCNNNNAHIEKEDSVYIIKENEKPSTEFVIKQYQNAVQSFLDSTAQSRGYDNTYTCLSYLNSTNEKWKIESNAFNAWRDSVWLKCHEILNEIMASDNPELPTIDEVISQLPEINWNDPV